MNTKKRQIAYIGDLRIREDAEGKPTRIIEGYALKFGVRSRLLCDWCDLYYEVLEPGSVTKSMLDKQDIKLTMFHDRQLILARSKKGKGTLSYEVNETGVLFRAELPATADGDKAWELIGRGDITGCSFIYSTDESPESGNVTYEYLTEDKDGSTIMLRHVNKIENVYDFTVTPDPAYEQTNVTRREAVDGGLPEKEEEEVKRDEPTDEQPDGEKPEEPETPQGVEIESEGDSDNENPDSVDEDDEKREKRREALSELRQLISRR